MIARVIQAVIRPGAAVGLTAILPIVGLTLLGWHGQEVLHFMESCSPAIQAIILVGCGLLAGAAFLPTHAISLLSGWLFGSVPGSAIALASVALGALLGLVLGRFLTGDSLQNYIESDPRWRSMSRSILKEDSLRSLLIVSLLRVSPAAPFAATNVAFAGLGTPTLPFLSGTVIGMTPRVIVVVYLGAALSTFDWSNPNTPQLFIIGLISAVLALLIVGHLGKKSLQKLKSSGGIQF